MDDCLIFVLGFYFWTHIILFFEVVYLKICSILLLYMFNLIVIQSCCYSILLFFIVQS